MKTNYFLHDQRYRNLRLTDNPGWDNAATLAKTLAHWKARLSAPYLPKQGAVLELGCGAGDLTLMMAAERGFQATGIDAERRESDEGDDSNRRPYGGTGA